MFAVFFFFFFFFFFFSCGNLFLRRHLSCRLGVSNSFFALSVWPPRLESHSALCLLRVRILRDGTQSLSSTPYRISLCDRRRSTVDKNCQNQPIRGYTRIWYTGTLLTSIPAPLSPVLLYFSSLSLLRTALHNLNAWNRLRTCGRKLLPTDSSRPLFKQIEIFFWHTDCMFQL